MGQISTLMTMTGKDESIYYDPDFRIVLESHLEYFRNHPSTVQITIPDNENNKYSGDLCGLMLTLKIPDYMHWLVIRTTGLSSPNEADKAPPYFLVPSREELERIRQQYLIIHRLA